MLKRHRLRHTSDFRRLESEGKRYYDPFAVLIIRANGLDISRFGFTASRRVGNAVNRNASKRKFKEAVRRRMGEVRPGWDCLFIIKPRVREASSMKIEKSVIGLFDKAGLIKDIEP